MAVSQVLTRSEFYAKYPAFADLPWDSDARRRWLANHPGAAAQWTAVRDVEQKMVSTFGENWRNTAGEQWNRVVADYLDGGFNVPLPTGGSTPGAPAPAPPPPAPAAPAPRDTSGDASARAIINGTLASFGLGTLGDWAWQQYLNGVPTSQIMLDLRARPEYAARFPGMAALSQAGVAISEQEYIGLESGYRQVMRSYGTPATFYDSPDDFGRLIAGQVSVQEFGERLDMAEQVAATDPRGQTLRAELARLYGAQGLETPANVDAMVTAWFIDPDKAQSLIEQQFRATTTAAAATRTGFGQLTLQEAEEVAGYGTTEEQATQTFGQLATMDEFLVDLPGGADDNVERRDLLQAGFAGNADSQGRIETTRRRRKGAFQGGGGYAAGERGISGLGTA
jgi:hypothetical protein